MRPLARQVAEHVVRSRWSDVPDDVRRHATRLFVNWTGCAVGGSAHPAVESALAAVRDLAGAPQATVLGRALRMDIAYAALLGVAPAVTALADAVAIAQRTFVASNGNDAGPCSIRQPCRSFAAAVANTNANGEVIATTTR